jgi:hypothetical protein
VVGPQPLSGNLSSDLLDIRHVAADAALDLEVAVDLDLRKQLLHLTNREVGAILGGVPLLDRDVLVVGVLIEGVYQ